MISMEEVVVLECDKRSGDGRYCATAKVEDFSDTLQTQRKHYCAGGHGISCPVGGAADHWPFAAVANEPASS